MLYELHEQLEYVDWHNEWEFDLETATARHREGWVFQFHPIEGNPGVMIGECTDHPLFLHPNVDFDMVAQQAGEIYFDALRQRH